MYSLSAGTKIVNCAFNWLNSDSASFTMEIDNSLGTGLARSVGFNILCYLKMK